MNIVKYKITATKAPGYMMVIYQDGLFKSCLNEFKPALNEKQLNTILNLIPNDPALLAELFKPLAGKVKVEPVKPVGAEPALQPASKEGAKEYGVNEKIALFCWFYSNTHKDELGAEVKYKTGAAEAGKLKALVVTPEELELLFKVYFSSQEWWAKPKSISNFINKYNEVRALAYTPKKEKTFPLPYDDNYFAGLGFMEKQEYHKYLRANGYRFELNAGRGGKWVNY